jgi:hypothetical protein
MKSFQHLVLTTIAALSVCPGASAQQVYRCGNSYSQTPCAGAVAVSTDDPRSDDQRAQAKQGLTSDKELAKDLEATRRKDESMALAQMKATQASQHKKEAGSKPPEKKEAKKKVGATRKVNVKNEDPGVFTAAVGGSTKKKKTTSTNATP